MRILMTPDAEASGGGEAVVTPPTPTPSKPFVIPPDVTVKLDRLAELERKQAERDDADRKRDEAEAIKRGEYEKIIAARDADLARSNEKAREAESRSKKTTLDRELALALASQPLRPGAAKHLTKLLADDLEAVPDADGGYTVRSKDRRSVADFIDDTLKSPEYDSFVSSTAKPGVPAGGGSRSAATPEPPTPAPAPRNLGEALLNAFNEVRSNPANATSGPRGFKAIR